MLVHLPHSTVVKLRHDRDRLPLSNRRLSLLLFAVLIASPLLAVEPVDPAQTVGEQAEEEQPGDNRPALLGGKVPRGQFEYRYWSSAQSIDGLTVPAPVLIVGGAQPGPTLCLTGAVHGDELNGVEIIRRVLFGLEPEKVNGTVIGLPIVNLHGFRRSSRYLADRRDLNRFFPGHPRGSSASRVAHSLFNEVIRHCDYLVDIHTGSFQRTNLAQVRADVSRPEVLRLARMFGDIAVLNHRGAKGTLRRAATDAGIAAVTVEVGEPLRLQPDQVAIGVRGIKSALAGLGMSVSRQAKASKQPVYYESSWLRTDDGGILLARVDLGEEIHKGQVLGTVTDPITNRRNAIISPYDGRIIGMAINQVVMPGFAAFHIGRDVTRREVAAGADGAVPQPRAADAADEEEPADDADALSHESETEPAPGQDDAPRIELEPDDHSE